MPISPPATSTTTSTVTSADPPPRGDVVPTPPTAGCARAPKWVSAPPCVRDGFLYGAGEYKSGPATYLARSTAANRARKRLALALGAHENDKFELKGSEIDQIFHCEDTTYALARVRHKGKSEFATCSDETLAAAPLPKGCPAWTSRMAWAEGDTLYGVAPVVRVVQKFQAESSAANRARHAVSEMVGVELELTPDGVNVSVPPTALTEKKRSIAECEGGRWMMVAFQKGGSTSGDQRLIRPAGSKPQLDRLQLKKK